MEAIVGFEVQKFMSFCEDGGVVLVGFDGVGLDLLELSERGAFGYERKYGR